MKVEIEDVSATKKVLTIEVSPDVVIREFSVAYEDLRRRVKIPGFRPGKVPLSLLERRFGKEVEADIIKKLVPDYYMKALQEYEIAPISTPEIGNIDLRKEGVLKFTATVEVTPRVEKVTYDGIELKKEDVTVTDKDVEERLEYLRDINAQLVVAEEGHAVEDGDYVVVDYEGFKNGKPVPDLKKTGVLFQITAGVAATDMERGLMGTKKGQEVEIPIPEENLLFKVKVVEIKKKVLLELNDDFARDMGDYDSLDELKEDLRKKILEEKKDNQKAEYKRQIVKKLIELNPVEAPSSLVEKEVERFLKNTRRLSGKKEFEPEEEKALREKYRPYAEEEIKGDILLMTIGEHEGIEATEEDIEEEIKKIARRNNQEVEKVRESIESMDRGLQGLKNKIMIDRVFDHIMEKVKWIEEERSEDKC